MKISPIDALTNGRQTADARALSSGQSASTDAASDSTGVTSAASTAAARKVAQQFEAIFLRKLMSGLEKAGSLNSTPSTGSQIYGSMMVGAFADKASEGGGLGLASLVLKSLLPQAPAASASGGLARMGATASASTAAPASHAGTAARLAGPPLTPALDIGTGFGGGKP